MAKHEYDQGPPAEHKPDTSKIAEVAKEEATKHRKRMNLRQQLEPHDGKAPGLKDMA